MDVLSHQRGLFTQSFAAADPAGGAIWNRWFLMENHFIVSEGLCGAAELKTVSRQKR
jgi:hypothetical protein